MDRTYNTNNIWTTTNGFTIERRRPNTPGRFIFPKQFFGNNQTNNSLYF